MIATIIACALMATCLTVCCVPNAPIARVLHRWLVEWPAAMLLHVERRHLILLAVMCAMLLLSEGIAAAGLTPDLAIAAAWDISTFVDLAILGWTMSSLAGLQTARRFMAHSYAVTAKRLRRRPRAPRSARRPAKEPSANDDDRPLLAA